MKANHLCDHCNHYVDAVTVIVVDDEIDRHLCAKHLAESLAVPAQIQREVMRTQDRQRVRA